MKLILRAPSSNYADHSSEPLHHLQNANYYYYFYNLNLLFYFIIISLVLIYHFQDFFTLKYFIKDEVDHFFLEFIVSCLYLIGLHFK